MIFNISKYFDRFTYFRVHFPDTVEHYSPRENAFHGKGQGEDGADEEEALGREEESCQRATHSTGSKKIRR